MIYFNLNIIMVNLILKGSERGVLQVPTWSGGQIVQKYVKRVGAWRGWAKGSGKRRRNALPSENKLLPTMSLSWSCFGCATTHRHVLPHHSRPERGAGPPSF